VIYSNLSNDYCSRVGFIAHGLNRKLSFFAGARLQRVPNILTFKTNFINVQKFMTWQIVVTNDGINKHALQTRASGFFIPRFKPWAMLGLKTFEFF
jgi:hypothetical protein